eukprot:scaffold305861_cov37-Tisochrysis_lutea.AAC.2
MDGDNIFAVLSEMGTDALAEDGNHVQGRWCVVVKRKYLEAALKRCLVVRALGAEIEYHIPPVMPLFQEGLDLRPWVSVCCLSSTRRKSHRDHSWRDIR